ncbi:MAG TPA: hypothetical protein VFP91_07050 [Vicinamibacterales bacterium]|nr:hypothetical protein [Vicinamibacterales bacterium]
MMPYTYTSLVFTWLIILVLLAVSASGVAPGGWFVLLLAVASAVPAFVLRGAVDVASVPSERPFVALRNPKIRPWM